MKPLALKENGSVRVVCLLIFVSCFVPFSWSNTYVLEEVEVEGEVLEEGEGSVFLPRQERFVSQAVSNNTSVALSTQGSPLQNTFAYIRGVPSQGTTVLEDGLPLNTQSELGRTSLGPFVTLDVEDVRVIPGTQVGQGAHPLGGLIAMHTKRGQGRTKFSSLLERGSLRSTTLSESVEGGHEKGDFYVSGTLQKTGLGARVNKLHGNRVADEGALQRVGANVGVKLSHDMTLRTIGHLTAAQNALDDTPFGGLPQAKDDLSMQLTRGTMQTNLVRHEGERDEGFVRAYLVTYDGFFEGPSPFKTRTRTLGMTLSQKKEIMKNWHGWGGYDLAFDRLVQRSTTQEDHSECVHTVTLGSRYEGGRLRPEGEVKLYRAKGGALEASYAAGLRAHLLTTTDVFVTYGRGIKRPLLMEKYGAKGGFQLPNPDLVSQRSHTGSVGVVHRALGEKLILECTLFNGILTKLIAPSQVAPLLYQTRNQGTRHFEGMETKVNYAPWDPFKTSLSYTMTRVRVGGGQDLATHIPRHQASWDVEVRPMEDVTLFSQLHLQTQRLNYDFASFPARPVTLRTFATLRLGVSWDANEHISAFSRVENVGGTVYETNYGYGARGRTFVVGGRVRL